MVSNISAHSTFDTQSCGLLHCSCPGSVTVGAGPDPKWMAGFALSAMGSVGTVTSMVLQKSAHNRQQSGKTNYRELNGILLSPLWLMGCFMLVVIPMPLDTLALSMAPQSVIAPLSGVTIVLSQVVAPRVLGERNPSRAEWGWSLVVLGGTAMLARAGDQCSVGYTTDEIKSLFTNPVFLMVEVVQLFAIVVALMCVHRPKQLQRLILLPAVLQPILQPLGYAYLAGALAGQQNMLLKALSETLEQSFQGNQQGWADWLPYAILPVIPCTATLQVMNLNKGLSMMEATRYLPVR